MYPIFMRLMCASVAAAVVGSSVRADVLVSNMAEPFRGASPIGNNPNPNDPPDGGPWYWAAQSFVADGVSNALDSIEVMVGDGSVDPAPVVVAELRADDGGQIGALITTMSAPDMSGPLAVRTLTPDAPVTLDALATYWVVLGAQAPGDGTFFFAYADSNEWVGTGAIASYADSQDSGGVWNYGIDFPYFVQVHVTPQLDSDGDGVGDASDVCCATPPGAEVDAQGRPIGDLDLDCDTDLLDFQLFQRGFTGPLSDAGGCVGR